MGMIVATSGQYAPDLVPRISRCFDVVKVSDVVGSERAGDVAILLTRGGLVVDVGLLEQLPNLRLIVKAGAGLDTIDVRAAAERDIEVVATHGSAQSVADLALALLFSCLRYVSIF